jgi:hypothetical protein
MKIYMVTRGDLNRITTPELLKRHGLDFTIVTHDEKIADVLSEKYEVPAVFTGAEPGVHAHAANRNFIIQNLVGEGQWYVGVDDNITEIYRPPPDIYNVYDTVEQDPKYRKLFMTPLPGGSLMDELDQLRLACEEFDTVYGGFGYVDNYFFRRNKWRVNGYVKSKLFVACNDGRRWDWDPGLGIMLDHAKTYDTIARYGRTIVNQWIYPDHPRFQPGGLGSHMERMPHRLKTMEVFKRVFKGLVKINEGEIEGYYDNPTLAIRSQHKIDQWRKDNGYQA